MSTPHTKQSPMWLSKQDENDPKLNPHYRRSVRYYRKLYQAWPDWASNDPRIREIYKLAEKIRDWGCAAQVDHIIPISSDIVCGLHVSWNLQIITEEANLRKSNLWWPDCPHEQLELML